MKRRERDKKKWKWCRIVKSISERYRWSHRIVIVKKFLSCLLYK